MTDHPPARPLRTIVWLVAIMAAAVGLLFLLKGPGQEQPDVGASLPDQDAPGGEGPPPSGSDPEDAAMRFGIGAGSIAAQEAVGFRPDAGATWIGPWTLDHDGLWRSLPAWMS